MGFVMAPNPTSNNSPLNKFQLELQNDTKFALAIYWLGSD